jgi:hypothetical protein
MGVDGGRAAAPGRAAVRACCTVPPDDRQRNVNGVVLSDMGIPAVVYHYTDTAGLRGILDTEAARRRAEVLSPGNELNRGAFSMRFTDAMYLNDPLELQYKRAELASYIRELVEGSTELDHADFDEVLAWLEPDDDEAKAQTVARAGAYVACFSRDPGSLPQWRGYAGGRDYAIGFNTEQLQWLVSPMFKCPPNDAHRFWGYTNPMVANVMYVDEDVDQVLREMADVITKAGTSNDRKFETVRCLALVKQRAYKHEQEVRAFLTEGDFPYDVEFRDGALGLVPYITASYLPTSHYVAACLPGSGGPPLIKDIRVGPGEHTELREAAVVRLLRARHFEPNEIPVKHSEILFRG